MIRQSWRSVIDAWCRGGAGEVLRGLRGRSELHQLRAEDGDRAYQNWLRRHDDLWGRHADRDREEPCRVLRLGDPSASPGVEHRASDLATSSFVVGLGPSDILRPGALHLLGTAIRDGADVAYADEDVETDSGPGHPFLKPAWNETLALTRPGAFPGRPTAIAASLWDRVVQAAPDRTWTDHVLLAAEEANRITHIPLPLATRGRKDSEGGSWPSTQEQCCAATQYALDRQGIRARAEPGAVAGAVCVVPEASDSLVSVLIPTRDRPELVDTIADALERESTHQPIERIWLDHVTVDPRAKARLDLEGDRPHSRVLRFEGDFNFSRMINAGARVATGKHLLLLNNDLEPMTHGWIRDLAARLVLPGVEAVGPLLLYPDGSVQHAGIGLGIGTVTGHPFRGMSPSTVAPCEGPLVARDVSAVSGACLMVKRDAFLAAEGLDDERLPISFSDVDLCLKLGRRGARVLYEPAVTLVHHETVSRSPVLDPKEIAVMRKRWPTELASDPCLPPSISKLSEQPLLARRFREPEPRVWIRR